MVGGTPTPDIHERFYSLLALESVRLHPLLDGRNNAINAVAISPDGKWLATASSDKTTRIWDVPSGSEYLDLEALYSPVAVAFVRGTPKVAVFDSARDGSGSMVLLEHWQTEDLIRDACALIKSNLTSEEWKQYLGSEPYHRTCPNLAKP